jgi:hypothetical protein
MNDNEFVSICEVWSKAVLLLAGRMIENGIDITHGFDFQFLIGVTLVEKTECRSGKLQDGRFSGLLRQD